MKEEILEFEYLPDKGIFIGHYNGTEHSDSEGPEVPAGTFEGETRMEVLMEMYEHLDEHESQ